MLGKVLKSWGAIGVYVIVLGWSTFSIYMSVSAPGRIAPELSEALAREGKANMDVELPFTPSAFHVQELQRYGTIRRMRGRTILMRSVSKEQADAIARNVFWVEKLRLSAPAT